MFRVIPCNRYPAIKKAKQQMQLAYDSLVKQGATPTLAKAKASVEKLRNATRDMNKNLKLIRVN